jgi:hypothetical protein
LPENLQHVSGKFGKLIEEQHAVVGHADFAGPRDRDSLGALPPRLHSAQREMDNLYKRNEKVVPSRKSL